MKETESLTQRLVLARGHAKMTQQDLAQALGMTVSGYRTYETGQVTPKRQRLSQIGNETGVSDHWLSTGQGEMLAPKAKASSAAAPVLDNFCTRLNAIADRMESCLQQLSVLASATAGDPVVRAFGLVTDRADSGPLVQWMPSPGELFHARDLEGNTSYSQCVLRCVARDSAAVIADRVWSECDYGQKRQIISTHLYSFHQVGPEVAASLGLTPQ